MITLINPGLAVQKGDTLTTGIIYMPIGLACLAAKFKSMNEKCKVIDSFAEGISSVRTEGNQFIQGLDYDEIYRRIPKESELIIIYANNLISHRTVMNTVRHIKKWNGASRIALMENSQAVSAYSLEILKDEFLQNGVDFLITGDAEDAGPALLTAIRRQDRVASRVFEGFVENLDELPFPAWEGFPLEQYWQLGYAHGPQETSRYLPLLTSRGCPYRCKFCVSPKTTRSRWRSRTPENVISEISSLAERFDVREFHVEDLNPTVSEERMGDISRRILENKLDIVWKIVSGTKAETLKSPETVRLMKASGCNYISISPESGSEALLKSMDKSFDKPHALRLVKLLKELGIFVQACFVLGFPGETKDDLSRTKTLLYEMTRIGVDEVAIFIITPVPGSVIYGDFAGYTSAAELTFSPAWRKDFFFLNMYRLKLYFLFLLAKSVYHPLNFLMQIVRSMKGSYRTKMEMALFRAFKFRRLVYRSGAR